MEEVIQQLDALVEGLGQWQSRAWAALRGGKYIQRKRAGYISLGEEDCVFDNLFDYNKRNPGDAKIIQLPVAPLPLVKPKNAMKRTKAGLPVPV